MSEKLCVICGQRALRATCSLACRRQRLNIWKRARRMKTRACICCAAEFRTSSTRLTCSPECRHAAKLARNRRYRRDHPELRERARQTREECLLAYRVLRELGNGIAPDDLPTLCQRLGAARRMLQYIEGR